MWKNWVITGKFFQLIEQVAENFNIARGDKADRNSASRDVNGVKILQKLDAQFAHALVTALVDYLGANNNLKADITSSNNKERE